MEKETRQPCMTVEPNAKLSLFQATLVLHRSTVHNSSPFSQKKMINDSVFQVTPQNASKQVHKLFINMQNLLKKHRVV